MRILWLNANSAPWNEGESGWQVLQNFGIDVVRVATADEFRAQNALSGFACAVFEAEAADALALHAEVKNSGQALPTILLSSSWKKADFRKHAKAGQAADRYAPLPIPVDAFSEVAADLCGTTVAALQAQVASGTNSNLDNLFAQSTDANTTATSENASIDSLLGATVAPSATESQPQDVLHAALASANVSAPEFSVANTDIQPQDHQQISEETETLRKYLQLREHELAHMHVLKSEYEKENARLLNESQTKQEEIQRLVGENSELGSRLQQLDARISEVERAHLTEKESLEFELKAAQEQQKETDKQLQDANDRMESLKARVRKDIQQVRVRERELEAKLEMLRKDSETIQHSRDQQVLEMQKQIDELECDLDQIQDKRVEAETQAERYLAKLSRVARALHLALEIVESENISLSIQADDTFNALLKDLQASDASATSSNTGDAVLAAIRDGQNSTDTSNNETKVMDPNSLASAMSAAQQSGNAAPAAEAPAASEEPSVDFNALANDGEATRVVNVADLQALADKGEEQAG